MKPNTRCSRVLAAGSSAALLMVAVAVSQAQTTNFIVDQFDTDTTSQFANQSWGSAVPSITWDSTVNETTTLGPNNAGSGSALWTVDWSANPPNDQIMVVHGFPDGAVLDLANYTNATFDIRFDPSSATDGNGSYGRVELDWVPQSDGWPSTSAGTTFMPSTNNNWIHVEVPIDTSSAPKLNAVTGLGFKIQQSSTGSALTGISKFWIDNIILAARVTPLPAPTLSVTPVTTPPGLTIVASGGGNDYKRGMIRTLDPVLGAPYYSWVGHGDTPVSYSLTIASYPIGYPYFQSQIFLVPNGGNNSSVDYGAATCMALDIRNIPDGTATGTFRYKTNHVNANASDYVPAVLVCSNGVLGTWSMSFVNDTNVTVTAPDGTHTNFFLPDQDTAYAFSDPLSVYLGNQQNGTANAGQSSTYSRVQVTGPTFSPEIDDTFARADLNPDPGAATWQVVCDVPSDVFILQPDDKYWVGWTLPDTGFSLESSPTVAPGSWTDTGLTNVVMTTLGNRVLVPESSLPSASMGFFRMVKPAP